MARDDYETDETSTDEFPPEEAPAAPARRAPGAPPARKAAPPPRPVPYMSNGGGARPPRPPAAVPPRRPPVSSPRRGSRPIAPPAPDRGWVPWAVIGALSLLTVAVAVLVLTGAFKGPTTGTPGVATAPPQPTPDRTVITGVANYTPGPDGIVARVNGVPITGASWDHRVALDTAQFMDDPLFAMTVNNFEGITGTRMLDGLRYDSLDKLINMQVILQEAQKQNVIPSADQRQQLITQAQSHDVKPGQTFADFLKANNVTEADYDQDIINRVTYSAMAGLHMPPSGSVSDDQRTTMFLQWLCDTRKNYQVQIYVTFSVNNVPCTSGFPLPEVPIVAVPTAMPETVPSTGPAPLTTPGSPVVAPAPQTTGAAAPVATPTK